MTWPPGVQFRPWFHGRDPAIAAGALVPGGDGAIDLVVTMMPLTEPISAGRPPVPPKLPSTIELQPLTISLLTCSGRRVTRCPVTKGGDYAGDVTTPPVLWRAVVELEWGPMTADQWAALKNFLLDPAQVGLTAGGALRAMTIDIDGDGLTDSAVDVRILGADAVEQIVEADRVGAGGGEGNLYTFGPVRAEEVL